MPTPTSGPASPSPHKPPPPPGGPPSANSSNSSSDAQYAFLLQSPFAKMFRQSGAVPTAQQMKMIIDNILQTVISNLKEQEKQEKKALKHLRDVIEGKND